MQGREGQMKRTSGHPIRCLARAALVAGLLAACGPTTTATTTVPAAATTAATTRAASPTTAVVTTARMPTATTATATGTTAPAATTRAATPATATRPAAPPAGTATRSGSPPASAATRTASPAGGAVLPNQAAINLRQLDSSRQAWTLDGFTIAGLSGEFRPVYEYHGGDRKVTIAPAGAPALEAYEVGGTIYVPNPLGGAVQADAANPLGATARGLFGTPRTILDFLIPASANYTRVGTEMVNGQQTTKYTANVAVADLGFVSPALQGQRGTAATQVWVDNSRGYIVALESDIRAETANAAAKVRLDTTAVGQVPPITVPR